MFSNFSYSPDNSHWPDVVCRTDDDDDDDDDDATNSDDDKSS